MLIISKFHDYYDSAIGFGGIDKSIVYNRTEIIDDNHTNIYTKSLIEYINSFNTSKYSNSHINLSLIDNKNDITYFTVHIIGFCGKLYVCFELERFNNRSGLTNYEVIWDRDKIKSMFKYGGFGFKNTKSNYLDEIFNKIDSYNDLTIFRECNTPIFQIKLKYGTWGHFNKANNEFVINPNLSNLKFQTKFEPYSAFQEIEMFISGVLGVNPNNTIEIDDKYKIQSHGFDNWSFRNPNPPKRKNK